ncbi:hypothetical protein GGI22_006108, partial [Coemansia erecta]
MTLDVEKKLRTGLYEAIKRGYEVLQKGGKAIDAVEAAVCALEDNPLFNAGKGAVFNIKGVNQLEASIMCGDTGAAGAGTLLTTVKNPIKLARKVLESNHHVFLGGAGAESYAHTVGLEIVDPAYFWTKNRWEQHERGFLHSACAIPNTDTELEQISLDACSDHTAALGATDTSGDYSHLPMGTVGAIAVDVHGHLAAATSTGGMSNKWDGRIGDTPIIGAGTWADKRVAISGTGTGEYYIRQGTAHSIALRMKLLGEDIGTASATAMVEMMEMGGDGGVICRKATLRHALRKATDARGEQVFKLHIHRPNRQVRDAIRTGNFHRHCGMVATRTIPKPFRRNDSHTPGANDDTPAADNGTGSDDDDVAAQTQHR